MLRTRHEPSLKAEWRVIFLVGVLVRVRDSASLNLAFFSVDASLDKRTSANSRCKDIPIPIKLNRLKEKQIFHTTVRVSESKDAWKAQDLTAQFKKIKGSYQDGRIFLHYIQQPAEDIGSIPMSMCARKISGSSRKAMPPEAPSLSTVLRSIRPLIQIHVQWHLAKGGACRDRKSLDLILTRKIFCGWFYFGNHQLFLLKNFKSWFDERSTHTFLLCVHNEDNQRVLIYCISEL